MKTFLSFMLAMFLAVIIASMGGQTSSLLGTSPTLSAGAAALDNTSYIYTFDKSPLAGADTKALIKRFLGTADYSNIYRSDDDTVYFSAPDDLNTTFEQNRTTGDIRFHRGMSRYLGDFEPKLPSKDKALLLAQNFLKENDLLPQTVGEIKLAHVGGLRAMSTIDGKQAGPVLDKLVTITYSRVVDGLPVMGPGSKLVLGLGDQGEVVSLVRHWRELNITTRKTITEKELYSNKEALALAKRQITAEYGQKASFKILGSSHAYFDNNGNILQPIYVFEAAITLGDRKVRPFNYLCVVQGLKESPEPLALTTIDEKAKGFIRTAPVGKKLPTPSGKERRD